MRIFPSASFLLLSLFVAGASGQLQSDCQGADIVDPALLKKLGLDNWNTFTVNSGAADRVINLGSETYCLMWMATYHWNDGKGAVPGSITIKKSDGSTRTYPAVGTPSGPDLKVKNANWEVTPEAKDKIMLLTGTITVTDSDRATWSWNKDSEGGFTRLWVRKYASAATPPTTPPPATPPPVTAPLGFKTISLPGGRVSQNYGPFKIEATGGCLPYNFTFMPSRPNGLSTNQDGTLSGVPLESGLTVLTVVVTDACNGKAQRVFDLDIANPGLSFKTTSLPDGRVNQDYGQVTIEATGGCSPYSFSDLGLPSRLPKGLKFVNGIISGIPEEAGERTVTLVVTDDCNETVQKRFAIKINEEGLRFKTTSLPVGNLLGSYGPVKVEAIGGCPPYTFLSVYPTPFNDGFVPLHAGLVLQPDGTLSGKPTEAGVRTVRFGVRDGCNTYVVKEFVVTVTAPTTQPPVPGPLSCVASAAVPPTVRAEGVAELLGDVVINCKGGTQLAEGAPAFLADFKVFLNTNVTSRLLTSNLSEALLLIDEPSAANQRLCAQPTRCTSTDNVFPSQTDSPTSLTFFGVPLEPPGNGTRTFRVTGMRANAAGLGTGEAGTLPQITATISVSPPTVLPINGLKQVVAVVQPGINSSVLNAPSLPQCASTNSNFGLRFTENFETSFKTRFEAGNLAAPSQQGTPGTNYQAESGFYNPNLSQGSSAQGLADHGTRLAARFSDIPAGVRIYGSLNSLPGTTGASAAATTNESGKFNPPSVAPGLTDQYEIPLINGSGLAVWEVMRASPQIDTFFMPIFVAYSANAASNLPISGTGTVSLSFAPIALPAPMKAQQSFPLFVDRSHPQAVFSITSCGMNPLSPFFTNSFGSDTEVVISNTSQDLLNPLDTPPTKSTTFWISNQNPVTNITHTVSAGTAPQAARAATSNWLTIDVNQTSTPATALVTTSTAGLAAGMYTGSVTISSPQASAPLQVPIRFNVLPLGPYFTAPGVVNAASYFPAAVSPGEAIVVFGRRYGPPSLAMLQLDASGVVATAVGETRVFFDSVAAPMIYAANGQVSAFVPFAVAGKKSTVMRVEYRGAPSLEVTLPVSDAIPGLFTSAASGGGQGAILNQDYSPNNRSNPAAEDGIILLFGTGAGQTNPTGRDGHLATAPLPQLVLPVKAYIGGEVAEVLYAGPAPDLIEGVLQVNARIPRGIMKGDAPVWITVGDKRSQPGVSVAVR